MAYINGSVIQQNFAAAFLAKKLTEIESFKFSTLDFGLGSVIWPLIKED